LVPPDVGTRVTPAADMELGVGTAGNREVLGRPMRRQARRVRLGEAKVTYAVTDGAEWIASQCRGQLPIVANSLTLC